jgi:DNA-directed RNA polymerase I, II, and III subunit RPABC2
MAEEEENEFEVMTNLEDFKDEKRRRTRPKMTRFERARVLAMRAEQIANGTQPFVEIITGDHPIDTAEREFAAGRIPFIIRRFVPSSNGGIGTEDWMLDELAPCDRRLSHQAHREVYGNLEDE